MNVRGTGTEQRAALKMQVAEWGGGLLPTCLGSLPFVLLVDFVVIRQVVTNIPLLFGPENCEESCLETQPRSLGSHN